MKNAIEKYEKLIVEQEGLMNEMLDTLKEALREIDELNKEIRAMRENQ